MSVLCIEQMPSKVPFWGCDGAKEIRPWPRHIGHMQRNKFIDHFYIGYDEYLERWNDKCINTKMQ